MSTYKYVSFYYIIPYKYILLIFLLIFIINSIYGCYPFKYISSDYISIIMYLYLFYNIISFKKVAYNDKYLEVSDIFYLKYIPLCDIIKISKYAFIFYSITVKDDKKVKKIKFFGSWNDIASTNLFSKSMTIIEFENYVNEIKSQSKK